MMAQPAPAFSQRSILLIFLIAGIAFTAMLVLLVVNSGRQQGSTIGPNAFSHSAIGHRAFVELIDRAGLPLSLNRGNLATRAGNDTLVIAAEPPGPESIGSIDPDLVHAGAILVVLPKWRGTAAASPGEWIERARPVDLALVRQILDVLAPGAKVQRTEHAAPWSTNQLATDPALDTLQLIQSDHLHPLVANEDGMLLAAAPGYGPRLWILSDPDVIANHGIGHGENAAFALDIVETLLPAGGTVIIDETLHGFRRTESLWRTILAPPFLPTALQAGLATALLAWAAAVRFGRPEPVPPVLSPGTATLVIIGARLLCDQQSGHFLIQSYAASAASEVIRRLRLGRPPSDPELAAWLDRIGASRDTPYSFSELMRQAAALQGVDGRRAPEVVRVARRLERWKRDLIHGS